MLSVMRWVALLVVAASMSVACGSGPAGSPTPDGLVGAVAEVHVYDAWVPPIDEGEAEISMRVHNAGGEDDRLLNATCACDATVVIDGALVIAPEEEVVLAPGGTPGIRLTHLTEPLPKGGFVTLTLTFEHAGVVTAEVEARRPTP